jgi:TonB family protein
VNEPVSEVLVARARGQGTLTSPLMWSVAAHVLVVAALMLAPTHRTSDAPRTVMTISLAGAPGPQTSGRTEIGGQAIPEAPPEPPKPRPLPPPPASAPKVAVPSPKAAPPRPAQSTKPVAAPPTAEAPREGSTRVDTGARGQGFGLSSGGGANRGVELDVANFCCPEYLERMILVVKRSWDQRQGTHGVTTMRFTILRDGTIQAVTVHMSSGFYALDNAAERALVLTQRLDPLPAQFPNPTLTIRMRFEY